MQLEKLLGKALPSRQKLTSGPAEKAQVHDLIAGEYLDDRQLIFQPADYCLPLAETATSCCWPVLPGVLLKYAGWVDGDPGRIVFIDTETTGLSGGTGTLVFLVGCGSIDKDHFRVRQFLLCDPEGEEYFLQILAGYLANFDKIISFNGKSFDLPLLRTRFILNRLGMGFARYGHLDLYHLSRRIWQGCLPDCTLQSIERAVLGLHRQHDISGAEIPEAYFDYLATGNATLLTRIIQHNRVDITSLYTLLRKLISIIGLPGQSALSCNPLGLARLFEFCGEQEQSLRILQDALMISDPSPGARQKLSMLYKRRDCWEVAEKLWLDAAAEGEIYAHIELAKLYEHKYKDPGKALFYTEKALELISDLRYIYQDLQSALYYRIKRLLRKLNNAKKD